MSCDRCGTTTRPTHDSAALGAVVCGRCYFAAQRSATAIAPGNLPSSQLQNGEERDEVNHADRHAKASRPFALSLDDFIAAKSDSPPPLIGTSDDNVLPAFGLALLVAKGGKGKTTLTVELALHLASARDWLGFQVARPLRVLFIENEGPREPFRLKLERRRATWPHELTGAISVYDEDWGMARLDDESFVARLCDYCASEQIDLVIGDPLDSLGMEGEGSPSETREMVDRFKAAGLFSTTAWWLPHHSRKEKVDDAIDEASGAWGGRPDVMLVLERQPGDRARLSFPKIRYGRRDGFAYILGFDPDTKGFEYIDEASDRGARDYGEEITELLEERPYLTCKEIAAPRDSESPGIGASEDKVSEALEAGEADQFRSLTGEDAKAVGRHPNATVWCLRSRHDADDADTCDEGERGEGLRSAFPLKGAEHSPDAPRDSPSLRPAPDADKDQRA